MSDNAPQTDKTPKAAPYDRADRLALPMVFGDVPSFLGAEPIKLPVGAAGRDVIFMGVPWEGPITWGGWSGCELATKSIRQASARYGGYLPDYDIDATDHLNMADAGDVAVTQGDSPATMAAIRRSADMIVAQGARPFFLGGDHSYTPEIVAALSEAAGGPVGIVHLDAHLDNNPDFDGDPFARCCPLYRIYDIEGVRNASIVHFGIRGPRSSPLQAELVRRAGAQLMTMAQIRAMGFEAAVKKALDLAHQGTRAVYLTICSDILEAAFNPGGPPDFDGLTPHELFRLVNLTARRGLAGMDYVEIYPPQDPSNRSSHLAAWTFIHALCGLVQAGGQGREG